MQPQPPTAPSRGQAPSFYVIGRQPLRPEAIVLAFFAAAVGLFLVSFGLAHSRTRHLADANPSATRSPGATPGSASSPEKDESDDPSQVDTIVLGDAADAPVPARRTGRISDVHATILIHLPRFGPQVGLIPDTPGGHLLYRWLAAFNQGSSAALAEVLPNIAPLSTAAAQMQLRLQTGGFTLLSAKEVQPGLLVFRLRDQSPSATEVLGALQMRANSNPPQIASFSLRAVLPAHPNAIRKTP